MVAQSEESRSQEQTRAKQEMKDSSEKHQEEVSKLQEKIKQLVRADAPMSEISFSVEEVKQNLHHCTFQLFILIDQEVADVLIVAVHAQGAVTSP